MRWTFAYGRQPRVSVSALPVNDVLGSSLAGEEVAEHRGGGNMR